MDEMLKGNYKVTPKAAPPAEAGPTDSSSLDSGASNKTERSIEELFESSALEKLGGSIAFVKKSASFLWKGK